MEDTLMKRFKIFEFILLLLQLNKLLSVFDIEYLAIKRKNKK
jgi:hypothetical protein